ncbi:hypothetical protein [Bacillus cereus]|uniref:hypothetical protein n=1 Tax=Bacillus cereus TaxID=1396 RepID=UPI003CEC4C4C
MKKKFLTSLALTTTLITSVGTISTQAAVTSKDPHQVKSMIQQERKSISADIVNKVAKEKGFPTVQESQIPTIKEVNNALANIHVSKDNPKQTIDLGNGFQITAEVSESKNPTTLAASQSKTATGQINYSSYGVNWYSLKISENFTYNGQKITYHSPNISANAYGFVGWDGNVTGKYISDIDPSAKDAIADASYKYLKLGGTGFGHIELRFTGTGNYYIHDSYFF